MKAQELVTLLRPLVVDWKLRYQDKWLLVTNVSVLPEAQQHHPGNDVLLTTADPRYVVVLPSAVVERVTVKDYTDAPQRSVWIFTAGGQTEVLLERQLEHE